MQELEKEPISRQNFVQNANPRIGVDLEINMGKRRTRGGENCATYSRYIFRFNLAKFMTFNKKGTAVAAFEPE